MRTSCTVSLIGWRCDGQHRDWLFFMSAFAPFRFVFDVTHLHRFVDMFALLCGGSFAMGCCYFSRVCLPVSFDWLALWRLLHDWLFVSAYVCEMDCPAF